MNRSAAKPEALARHLRPPGTLEAIAKCCGGMLQLFWPVNWWLGAWYACLPSSSES
jgi:hypothetical protein